MLRYRTMMNLIILLYLLTAACAYAEEEVEDFIDVFTSDGKIVAVIEGEKTVSQNLRLKEAVLWSDSAGYLGAVLTDVKFYVVSTASNAWQALPLKLNTSEKEVALLSETLALIVMQDRAAVFDAAAHKFVETRIPIRDDVIEARVAKNVAVVITSSRAFAFAPNNSTFAEARLRMDETVSGVRATSNKATIHTSERVLTFSAKTSRWKALKH